MSTLAIQDTSVLTGRSLRHILRSPDTIITTCLLYTSDAADEL